MADDKLYQCSCGETFTDKGVAQFHAKNTPGSHIVKRVR